MRQILSRCLHSHSGAVTAWMAVHAAHYSRYRRLLSVTCWWMSDVCTQEDDRLLKYRWPRKRQKQPQELCLKRHFYVCLNMIDRRCNLPLVGYQYIVDAPQFGVNLETEIGERLRGSFYHILYLDTLGCHAKQSVTNTLYFRWRTRDKIVLPNNATIIRSRPPPPIMHYYISIKQK